MSATNALSRADGAAVCGKALLESFGVANIELDGFRGNVKSIAEADTRDHRLTLEQIGRLYSLAARARMDVGQFVAWLDELDADLAELAIDPVEADDA